MLPVPGNNSLSLSIGRVPLTLHEVEPSLRERASRRYAPFLSPEPTGLPIFLSSETAGQPASSFSFAHEGAELVLASDRASFSGVRNEFLLDSLIRILLTRLLLPERGFLLHAATIVRKHRAYVFTGRSGMGKSTIAALSPAGSVLTDEISLLRRNKEGWEAHGTPFWGEFRAAGQNSAAPLAGVYVLAHATENRLEPLDPSEILRAVMPNILFFGENRPATEALLGVLAEMIQTVPCYRLWFRRDTSFWEVVAP